MTPNNDMCFPWDPIPDHMTYYEVFKNNSYDPEAVTFIDVFQYIKSKMETTGEYLFLVETPYIIC